MNERKNTPNPFQKALPARNLLWLLILTTLVVASVIIFPITPTPRPAVDSKILGIRIMLCLVGVAALFNWKQLTTPKWEFLDSIFAGLLLSFGLSTVTSGNIGYCLMISWHQAALICLAWLIYRINPRNYEIRSLSWAIGSLAVLASIYGLLSYSGHDILKVYFPFSFEEEQEGGRNLIHSFYGNPEYFAGFASPCLVITAGLALRRGISSTARVGWLISMFVILAAMILSGGRSALMACTAACVLLAYLQRKIIPANRRKLIYMGIAGIAVFGIAGLVILSTPNPLNPKDMRLFDRFANLFNTQSTSVRERINFYISTASSIYETPLLGHGPGTYRLHYFSTFNNLLPEIRPGIAQTMLREMNNRLAEHAHNDYIEYWADYGTIGIGLFVLLMVHLVMRMWASRNVIARLNPTNDTANLVTYQAMFFCAALAVFLNAFTSFPFHMPERSTLAWIIIGTFFALNRKIENTNQPTL